MLETFNSYPDLVSSIDIATSLFEVISITSGHFCPVQYASIGRQNGRKALHTTSKTQEINHVIIIVIIINDNNSNNSKQIIIIIINKYSPKWR